MNGNLRARDAPCHRKVRARIHLQQRPFRALAPRHRREGKPSRNRKGFTAHLRKRRGAASQQGAARDREGGNQPSPTPGNRPPFSSRPLPAFAVHRLLAFAIPEGIFPVSPELPSSHAVPVWCATMPAVLSQLWSVGARATPGRVARAGISKGEGGAAAMSRRPCLCGQGLFAAL
jgi:hypothetical protein